MTTPEITGMTTPEIAEMVASIEVTKNDKNVYNLFFVTVKVQSITCKVEFRLFLDFYGQT